MTIFNPDPRVRDKEPDSIMLGPNFPSSLNDLWKMVFRPSQNYLRYVKIAICNDDGSALNKGVEGKLDNLLEEAMIQRALLERIVTLLQGLQATQV